MCETRRQIFGIFLLLGLTEITFGIEKHWLPDLEWETGSNWIGGLLPDAQSRVVFPEETWHAVGLPNSGNLEVAEIYLPREGFLYLGKNGVLMLTGTKKIVKNVKWSKKGIYLWIDPENWDGYNDATPHTERIPCDEDIVVLPSKNRTLSLALPLVDVHVRGVRIADEKTTLNRWEWTQLADRPREFYKNRLTVTYASAMQLELCNECTCHGGTDEAISEEVCSYMWQAERCSPPICESPLKVEGHCCDYCGGRVGLSGKASLRKVESRVNEALENYRRVITWHVRKTWNGNTEVLIAENGPYNGINSQEAVDVLTNILKGDGYEVLENMATGSALTGSPLSTILGPMLGIPVILILLMLAVFPYFGYSYSQLTSGWREAWSSIRSSRNLETTTKSGGFFGFARFENVAEGDVRLNEDMTPGHEEILDEDSDVDKPSSSTSKRFENPLYRSKRELAKGKGINEEKMIDIDSPVSLATLESRVHEAGIEEVSLE